MRADDEMMGDDAMAGGDAMRVDDEMAADAGTTGRFAMAGDDAMAGSDAMAGGTRTRRTAPRAPWTVAGMAMVAGIAVVAGCTVEPRTDAAARGGSASAEAPSPRKQIVQPEGVARLPFFSSAVRSGDLLFLSGALGALPGVNPPQLVEGGVEAETRQTMENIRAVLEADSLGFEDLIKCTVFLADIADYGAVNDVYATYFPTDPPARSALAGSGLALGARVEIECIAAYPEGR